MTSATSDPSRRRVYLDTGVWIELRKALRNDANDILSAVTSKTTLHVSVVHLMDFADLKDEAARQEIGELIGRYATDPMFRDSLEVIANELSNLIRRVSPQLRHSPPRDASARGSENFPIKTFTRHDP